MINTLFTGKVYYRFDELPSTNDWAAELLAKSRPAEGTVVRADTQTAGRGQFGSRWQSEPGENLLLSVIYYPNWLAVQQQFYLSMTVALALHDLLGDAQHCKIKWPNDIYLDDHKTAGILIQNALSGNFIQSSIIGIGLNVNQLDFESNLPNPTSLRRFYKKELLLNTVLGQLLSCLEIRYLQLKSGKFQDIKSEYEAALYRKGGASWMERTSDGTRFQGAIQGVTEQGKLRVETQDAQVLEFDLKEVRLIF